MSKRVKRDSCDFCSAFLLVLYFISDFCKLFCTIIAETEPQSNEVARHKITMHRHET